MEVCVTTTTFAPENELLQHPGDWLTTVDQRKFDSLLLTNKPYRQASLETHSSLECSIFIQIKETIQNTSFAQKSFAGLITFAPENELE